MEKGPENSHLGFMKEDSQKWSCNYLFMKSASLWGPGRNISHPLDTRDVWCPTQVPSPIRQPLPSGTDELSPKLRAPSGQLQVLPPWTTSLCGGSRSPGPTACVGQPVSSDRMLWECKGPVPLLQLGPL